MSYTFFIKECKFVLTWVISEDDADNEDSFVLEANGELLSKLDYLDPNFKFVDREVVLFNG